MRVGVVTDLKVPNSMYRAAAIEELRSRGHEVRLVASEQAPEARLRDCDVVHIYREHDKWAAQLAGDLRAAGAAITWDNDDDHSEGPEGTRGAIRRGGMWSQRFRVAMGRMVGLANVVTTTNGVLAEHYREWGARDVRVIENYLPASYVPRTAERGAGLTVGWVAAAEHLYDLRQLEIGALLRRLLEEHPDLRVMSIGLDLRIGHERYRHVKLVQYRDLASVVAGFDIGIAPLTDIPFNRARSNVKLKEYAGAGVPWLASPVGPYVGMGEKQGGRLVPDDGWHAALERLIANPRERRKLAGRAARWARTQTVLRNLDHWEKALEAAVAAAAGAGSAAAAFR